MNLSITIPPELYSEIVERVKNELRAELARERSPWMTRAEAAAYLGCPTSRLEKARDVPFHRWDGRIFYSKAELDKWLGGKASQ